MSVQDIVDRITADHPKKYVDAFELKESPVDPLAKMTPTKDLFFGTQVLNFLIFTSNYRPFGGSYSSTKADLKSRWSTFAKYETHVFIDMDAQGIFTLSESQVNQLETDIQEMCDELAAYGFTYHGKKTESEISSAVDEIIATFSKGL